MANSINICIIGAGKIGHFYATSIKETKLFKLEYVIDTDIDKSRSLAKASDCHFHNDLDWVLQNVHFNAIIIATPSDTHYELIMKCLKYKKHILCEKLLISRDDLNECYKLADNNNLKLIASYQKRCNMKYIELYNMLNKEKPYSMHIISRDSIKKSYGKVEDLLADDIDIVNLFMNFELPIKIIGFLYEFNDIKGIHVVMQYKNKEIITIDGSNATYDQRVEICSPFGIHQLNNMDNNVLILEQLQHFYSTIINNSEPLVKHEHILLTKKICDAVIESIESNKVVMMKQLRIYNIDTPEYYLYKDMHINQTYDYVIDKLKTYEECNRGFMKMSTVLDMMDHFIDPSDPDTDLPNSIHAYQTAERIRKDHPNNYEFQITGLIHDLGKILYKFNEPKWAIVGDTYALGCEFPDTIVYYETMKLNPDYNNIKYNEKYGIYEPNCGIENLKLSFGHDEYLYIVLKNNQHKLSKKYMNMIRFHSFYPWHTGGSYKHLMNATDNEILNDVLELNKYDLYSKEDVEFKLTDDIKNYYDDLLAKFFPKPLKW